MFFCLMLSHYLMDRDVLAASVWTGFVELGLKEGATKRIYYFLGSLFRPSPRAIKRGNNGALTTLSSKSIAARPMIYKISLLIRLIGLGLPHGPVSSQG
ncbi:hypothetical protein BHE90_006819 [Fusarium euwallaceae]|uniref:Uncharacterized protein n=4 Tax=Fusarium solani species complex TaxID=232080 RepID=A0A3M2RRA0_9HYPO|nr:hypothetical protein CDV36_012668 [Fusarium kuroshium]RSL67118.1 hypothetical protein CEP51_012708 [Fusarium floridanum]RSM13366.1 hypothetical protein CEP52_001973 [Fusarium oligoseptatum]RTE78679.1 hypothetical protein BHE90_006819 [Fusarium euwallaceae]